MNLYHKYLNSIIDKTYLAILPIVKRINELKVCPNCLGNYINYECKYCHTENKELKELYFKLEMYLQRFNDYLLNLPINNMPNNKLFNLLYSISGIKLEIVENFLNKYHYDKVMDGVYATTIKKILNNEELTNLEIDAIDAIILRYDRDLEVYVDFFTKELLTKPLSDNMDMPMIKYETYANLVKYFVEKQMQTFSKNPTCEFVSFKELNPDYDDLDDSCITLGVADFGNIKLLEDDVKNLYIYGSNRIFNTIYHEFRHVIQFSKIINGHELSYLGLLETMDYIINLKLPGYYKENYHLISYELDASVCGFTHQLNLLHSHNVPVKDEDIILQNIEELNKKMFELDRYVNGNRDNLQSIFLKCMGNDLTTFSKYPQLSVIFKIENGFVVEKTKEELASEREKFLNSNIISEKKKNGLKSIYDAYLGEEINMVDKR